MAFEFVIEDSVEIYRDPGGERHHWTIVTGRLQTGFGLLSDLLDIGRGT